MKPYEIGLILYFAVVNLIAFFLYGLDKGRARRGAWRIPEWVLLTIAAVGGSVGAWCGMYVFHHKTRHKKFVIGVPAVLFVQLVILLIILCT